MEKKERFENLSVALLAALEGWQSGIWTALPGIVESFDPEVQTCSIRPAVQARLQDRAGNYRWATITLLEDVPVIFPSGGGFTMTYPIEQGDEALVILSKQCIDGWFQSGAAQQSVVPPDLRMHSLSDGFAIIGPKSKPRALAGFSTDTVQLRSDDGEVYVELAAGHIVNIVAPGGINLTGPLNVTGNTAFTGQVHANGKPIDETHQHTGVTAGGANSGPVL